MQEARENSKVLHNMKCCVCARARHVCVRARATCVCVCVCVCVLQQSLSFTAVTINWQKTTSNSIQLLETDWYQMCCHIACASKGRL